MMEFRARLLRLVELAWRLSTAKKLVKEIKSHPHVAPFLVGGRIRRTAYQSKYAPALGEFHKWLRDPDEKLTFQFGRANSKKRKDLLTPGIAIFKPVTQLAKERQATLASPLDVLAHEYGHVLQPRRREILENTKMRLAKALEPLAKNAIAAGKQDEFMARGKAAIKRAEVANMLTAERDATLRGAEALRRAGAGSREVSDYLSDISGGKQNAGNLIHSSYQNMYDSFKKIDPMARPGGKRLAPPRFPLQLGSGS
jgi:hypothetical protein